MLHCVRHKQALNLLLRVQHIRGFAQIKGFFTATRFDSFPRVAILFYVQGQITKNENKLKS